jgi:hypothetical protein
MKGKTKQKESQASPEKKTASITFKVQPKKKESARKKAAKEKPSKTLSGKMSQLLDKYLKP